MKAAQIVRFVLAVVYGASGLAKLFALPPVVANFHKWGVPLDVMMVIGVAEVLGCLGLLIAPIAPLACAGLALDMLMGSNVHATNHEPAGVVLTLVLFAANLFVIVDATRAYVRAQPPAKPAAH